MGADELPPDLPSDHDLIAAGAAAATEKEPVAAEHTALKGKAVGLRCTLLTALPNYVHEPRETARTRNWAGQPVKKLFRPLNQSIEQYLPYLLRSTVPLVVR